MRGVAGDQSGYNLVILVVAITVMNILVAAAIPLWRTAIKREKEEELISRGFQYAEAIRVFQHRYGRLPARLEELVEVKPRCIRRLWGDPVTGKRDWVPVRVMASNNVDRDEGKDKPDGDEDADGRDEPDAEPAPGSGGPATIDGSAGLGPIRGVRSRSKAEAIKSMFGQTRYDQWQFTVELLQSGGVVNVGGVGSVGVAGVPAAAAPRISAKWIGRPFRPGLRLPGMPSPQAPKPL